VPDTSYIITVDLTTKINNKKSLENILGNAFPNPTNGKFKIEYDLLKNQRISAEIYDMTGRLVDNFSETQFKGDNLMELDLSDKANGIYFLEVLIEGEKNIKKIVKY